MHAALIAFALFAALPAMSALSADLTVEQVRDILATTGHQGTDALSGKDLSRLDLSKRDFRGANLAGSNLFASKLVQTNFSGARLKRS
jgi:uncharacterized protein YjbI with pentapeptide repeats